MTSATLTGNTATVWAVGTAIDHAFVIGNAKQVTFSTNTIQNLPAKGTRGLGSAVMMFSTSTWSVTATKNVITANGAGVAIVTKFD